MATTKASDDAAARPLERAQEMSVETMGRMAEFWGFTRTQGRVYGALFLSPAALTQAEIVDLLGVSTANVSTSLSGLLRWGAVHKVYVKSSRKLHYSAEPEIRKVIRSVLGGREQHELREAVETFREAIGVLRDQKSRRKLTPEEEFVRERIAHLESVVRISNRLLDLLLGDGRLDLKRELGER